MSLKNFKPVHWLYNLFHYKQLLHNKKAYKKYNLHKSLIASVSSKDFPDKESRAWLDVGDSALIASKKEGFEQFSPQIQQNIIQWSEKGYMILENYFSPATCDAINEEIDKLMKNGTLQFKWGNKLMFANKKSELIRQATQDKVISRLLNFLLDKEMVPFQTINFINGSGQRAHSDSVHMTTYPLGYLIAIWVALEDVHADSGPLFYYPGSHKLPYLLNNDWNANNSFLSLGKNDYPDYEDMVRRIIGKEQISPAGTAC
ncbi:phytanoyl-CoA dioxygenase family protein [Niastella sp. OAS944]|uniref:phytanoyl-CoA dioxygenase family protein n=1 Tax=Niastella sp. OAS944 TaxID=2664089 RepID=UPI003486F123